MEQATEFRRAEDAFQEGRLKDAAAIWLRLGRAGDPEALYNAGNVLALQGNDKAAAKLLKKAAVKGVRESWFNLGRVLSSRDPKQALEAFLYAIAFGDAQGYIGAGIALIDLGRLSRAVQILEYAVLGEVDNAKATLAYALFHKGLINSPDERQRIRDLIAADPEGHPSAGEIIKVLDQLKR